jgi:levanase/fructan beta-fructosidase
MQAVTPSGTPGEQYKRYPHRLDDNWDYANVVPTQTWRGANTVVRELELVKDNQGYKINTIPVKNLDNYIVNTEVQKKFR